MVCSNNGFHAIVLKAFIGIWSVQENDWCQNNMNAAYKQLKIHWNLVNHCFEWKINMKFLFKKKKYRSTLTMTLDIAKLLPLSDFTVYNELQHQMSIFSVTISNKNSINMLKSTAEPNILVLFQPDAPLSLNLTLTHTFIPCLATQMWQKHHNRKG